MNLLQQSLVVARRDFTAIVATPTFLLFLLAPLMMIGFAGIGGASAGAFIDSAGSQTRIVAVVPETERAAVVMTDRRLRSIAGGASGPPQLIVMSSDSHGADAVAGLKADANVAAILDGPVAAPRVFERSAGSFDGRYLASIAETVAREGDGAAREAVSRPQFETLTATGPARSTQSGLAYGAVFVIFFLTLLLASQAVGMLAEEKSNKVIEILTAAVPLESVFFGKLLGMLGVALLFMLFWGVLLGGGVSLAVAQNAAPPMLLTLTPAIGWPLFLAFGLLYFFAAFLLLGAVFLGIGGLASTVREIQMLSLPITLFQVGMFALASAAANAPGTRVATLAQVLPWSSPFAMAGRGASDPAIWPHLIALSWQTLWIAITIWVSVRMFRRGVLRSGGSIGWFRRKQADEPLTA
jgi:ABC-2 type transport system permease protein